jgi:hypothetical protein
VNNPTPTPTPKSIMHYTFPTKAKEIQFAKIVKALADINAKDSLNNLKNFESVLENTLKRAKLILDASNVAGKEIKQETFAKLVSFTLPMVKKYLALGRELMSDDARDKVTKFKALNKGRLDQKQPVTYGIDAITDYLKGKEIYKTDAQKQTEKDKKENERTKTQVENKAKEQSENSTPSPSPSPNKAVYMFNPILFGFENDAKEDIRLNIIHSPKNTAKPYLVTSNVPSFVLRAMFDKILRHVERCEDDLKTMKQFEADDEITEIEDVDFTTFDSDYIQIKR